jgi:acetyl/propionyl-CoA carboxylase alpha subunit
VIRRVLIANRGEIALRVIRACRELGIGSVAVYSDADARSPHVAAADLAVHLGPPSPAASYLNIDALLDAARQTGADAVHPGYGFLSERARFARACEEAGLIFVGPPAAALERLGSKMGARGLMKGAGVPVVPGETPVDQSDQAIRAALDRVGLPALLKPAAGGGGIGMKTVRARGEMDEAIQRARREAFAAFGDGTLYVERLVERPRHIEVQVFADSHGHCIHLFERECSVQRRHQKTIEESPSTSLSPVLRQRMGEAAVAAARAARYVNAGTVEFLVEGDAERAQFYFLEMNARLQVEHPVTEAVVGVDLVQGQLRVAAGA